MDQDKPAPTASRTIAILSRKRGAVLHLSSLLSGRSRKSHRPVANSPMARGNTGSARSGATSDQPKSPRPLKTNIMASISRIIATLLNTPSKSQPPAVRRFRGWRVPLSSPSVIRRYEQF